MSRTVLAVILVLIVAGGAALGARIIRVTHGRTAIPVYPGAREAGGRTRYLPHLFAWDDRSSARVQRIFALPAEMPLASIARAAHAALSQGGWYLVTPDDLERIADPQVIVWQRDPDERLDLTKLWPLPQMTPEQRLYGGIFPAEFLEAPLVIEWSWALGGPRVLRASPREPLVIRTPPPPRP